MDAFPPIDGHTFAIPTLDTFWSVWETLTRYDDTLTPQPRLAESWDVTADLRQIKFNLRKGVQFHTGREFTSDDVKWNLLRVRDPKVPTSFLVQSNWFSSIDTPDKYTIVLKSDMPRPPMFDFFEFFNMLDPVTMQGPDAKSKFVGTGPFVFDDWTTGVSVTFSKNKNYWESGKPYLDGISVPTPKDNASLITQFEAGTFDVADTPPIRDAARLEQDPKYKLLVNQQGLFLSIMSVNSSVGPTANKSIRQALNFALDRQRYVDTILLKTAQPSWFFWPPSSLGYEAAKVGSYTYDLDKAKALVQSSGISQPAIDAIYPSTDTNSADLGQIFQADLAKIGITLTLKPTDRTVISSLYNPATYNGVNLGTSTRVGGEPSTQLISSRAFNYASNNSGFKSDSYTQLCSAVAVEPDPQKRRAIYSQINGILLDESFVTPVATNPPFILTTTKVNGVAWNQTLGVRHADLWLGQ